MARSSQGTAVCMSSIYSDANDGMRVLALSMKDIVTMTSAERITDNDNLP